MSVSVILTAYKRDYFTQQIKAIQNQTIKPKEIYIWQNGNYINIDRYRKMNVKLIKSDENFKFHGRFAFGLLMQTEYVAIFDDDIIPGKRWLENCLKLSKEKNCIVGANGRNYNSKKKIHVGIGPNNNKDFLSTPCKADLVGHCWFFKKEWLKYMWRQIPFSYDNGEDIHFCFTSKLFGNIDSYVAGQSNNNMDTKADTMNDKYAQDQHASWKISNHQKIRINIAENFIKIGFKSKI
jgi:hypothetical protein